MPHRPFVRTLRAQWLGQQLRDLREERGLHLKAVALHLKRDMSALSRYERGEWPVGRTDVAALLDLYGFYDAAERDRMLRLAEEVWRTDRWSENYGDVVDASFIDFPWLESRAELVCSYHTMLMPGLFQLPKHAEIVIRAVEQGDPTDERVARWVDLRMERQRVLDDPNGPRFEVIIDESVLRRRIGGPDLAAEQLRHLGRVSRNPRVTIRMLPTDVPVHAGMDGSFWLFQMPRPYPAVAYQLMLGGHIYMESPKSDRYVRAYDRLRTAAVAPQESALFITALAEEMASSAPPEETFMSDDIPQIAWHISSYSPDSSGSCVEAGPLLDGSGRVAVRHSRHPDTATIVYTRAEWDAFIGGVRDREFDFDQR